MKITMVKQRMVSWLVRINNAQIVCLPILTSVPFAFSMLKEENVERRREENESSWRKKRKKETEWNRTTTYFSLVVVLRLVNSLIQFEIFVRCRCSRSLVDDCRTESIIDFSSLLSNHREELHLTTLSNNLSSLFTSKMKKEKICMNESKGRNKIFNRFQWCKIDEERIYEFVIIVSPFFIPTWTLITQYDCYSQRYAQQQQQQHHRW